ncbi:MAG TPA: hypothetical protein PKD83_03420 [Ignavibacteria bacterium]|nr:hypothetical protein [Ignavibacteria bacterium]
MGKPYSILSGFILLIISLILFSFTTAGNNPPETNIQTLDAETVKWLSRVDSVGGFVSDSVITAVDDYIKEVKGLKYQSYSIRSLLLRENWFCGDYLASTVPVFVNGTGAAAPIGFTVDRNYNYPIVYTDTGAFSGKKGNGINSYIETGFNPVSTSEISSFDGRLMIYNMSDSADQGGMGSKYSGDGFYFFPHLSNGNTKFNIISSAESNVYLPTAKNYISVQRRTTSLLDLHYRDNLISTVSNTYGYKANASITFGGISNAGFVQSYSKLQLGGYSVGKSLSVPQQLIHYNAVQRLMQRLGRDISSDDAVDFKSKLFTFTGDKLVINYQSQNSGNIQFELQDQNGTPYPNFTLADCIPLTGNEFSKTVTWNNGSNLSSFVNTPVYLKIKMSNSDLYSLQFQNKIAETDLTKSGFKCGTYKQFFADTLLFANLLPVERKMNTPVKNPLPVISPVENWEGNTIVTSYSNIAYSHSLFEDRMAYKMWLLVRNSLGAFPAYYESYDGENWIKPNLESFKYNGSMNNNIITDKPYPGGLVTVIDDSLYNQTDSTRRYKSVYNTHTNVNNSFLNVSFSYDGIVWTPYSGNPVRKSGEDLSTSGWNPVLGKYLGYFRDSLGIRKVGRYLSDDFINWTYTGTILKSEPIDIQTTHVYNMTVLFKDSVYWGFVGILRLNPAGHEFPPNPSRTDNTAFIALMFSRDGIKFERCGNMQAFLNYGELGTWDDQNVYTIGVPVQIGNEFYIYCNGFNTKHYTNGSPPPPADGGPAKSQVGLAKIGVDRFLSLSNY